MIEFLKYKTFEEIQKNVWKKDPGSLNAVPDSKSWTSTHSPTIREIDYWEQIYHQPGTIGLFAAHSPKVEYYLLIFYPMLRSNNQPYFEFRGASAIDDIVKIMDTYNVNLKIYLTKS